VKNSKKSRVLAVAGLMLFVLAGPSRAGFTIYGSAYNGPGGAASLYSIDSSTGAAAPVGAIGFNQVGALGFNPVNGVLYGEGRDATGAEVLIKINTTNGAGTLVGALGITSFVQDISFRSDGALFAYSAGNIITINTSTGHATLVGNGGQGFPLGNGLAFSASGTLYTANESYLGTVNTSTGAITPGVNLKYPNPPFDGLPRTNGMDFDPRSGTLYASVVNQGTVANYLATINLTTGAVTAIGQTVANLDAIAVSPVPEPSSFALVTIGAVAGLALARQTNAIHNP
jgi:PEP-CTERM motif